MATTITVINEPGEPVTAGAWAGFADHVQTLAVQAQAVAFSGSRPPEVEPAALSELARSVVARREPFTWIPAVRRWRPPGPQPTGLVIKINRAELVRAGVNDHDFSLKKVLAAGQILLERGAALGGKSPPGVKARWRFRRRAAAGASTPGQSGQHRRQRGLNARRGWRLLACGGKMWPKRWLTAWLAYRQCSHRLTGAVRAGDSGKFSYSN